MLIGSSGRLPTARHCDPTADAVVTDAGGSADRTGGSSVSGAPSVDSLLIDPTASPATIARVDVGDWTSGTTAVVKEAGTRTGPVTLCASGAARGEHCGTV